MISIRPTTVEDFDSFPFGRPERTVVCWTVLDGSKILGIGGYGQTAGGAYVCSVLMTEEAKKYPVTLHRVAVKFMDKMRDDGLVEVLAEASADVPAAKRWLERLGFRSEMINGTEVFKCRLAS